LLLIASAESTNQQGGNEVKKKVSTVAGVLSVMLSVTSYASIIGSDVQITWWYPMEEVEFMSTVATVVDPGVEWNPGAGLGGVDISDGLIVIDNDTSGWARGQSPNPFNGFVISDVNSTIDAFTSLSLISVTGNRPPIDPVLSYSDDEFRINFNPTTEDNAANDNGAIYTFSFTTAANVPDGGVTLALLGSVVVALAGLRRKLSNTTVVVA
jgi:hypothetical protein